MIEYQIWRTGDGCDEEVCAYETRAEAVQDVREYRAADPYASYRVRRMAVQDD